MLAPAHETATSHVVAAAVVIIDSQALARVAVAFASTSNNKLNMHEYAYEYVIIIILMQSEYVDAVHTVRSFVEYSHGSTLQNKSEPNRYENSSCNILC